MGFQNLQVALYQIINHKKTLTADEKSLLFRIFPYRIKGT